MFEIGESIVLISSSSYAARVGATATVVADGHVCRDGTKVHQYGHEYFLIEWDDTPLRRRQQHGNYHPHCFRSNGGPW